MSATMLFFAVSLILALLFLVPILKLLGFSFRQFIGLPDPQAQNTFNRLISSVNTISSGNFYLINILPNKALIFSVSSSGNSPGTFTCKQRYDLSFTHLSMLSKSKVNIPCDKGKTCLCFAKISPITSATININKVYSCKVINQKIKNNFCIYSKTGNPQLIKFSVSNHVLSLS